MNVSSSIASVIPSSLESLSARETSKPSGGEGDEKVGKKFESLFYSMLLKEMRESLESGGEGGLFPGDDSDTLGGMFDMFMSDHLSQSSSLGIAEAVNSYMQNERSGGDKKNSDVTSPDSVVANR